MAPGERISQKALLQFRHNSHQAVKAQQTKMTPLHYPVPRAKCHIRMSTSPSSNTLHHSANTTHSHMGELHPLIQPQQARVYPRLATTQLRPSTQIAISHGFSNIHSGIHHTPNNHTTQLIVNLW
uniref:Uncharacterized protein n=1 Tax=Otarine gammaherpesvirus 4 TaxID=2801541 RepID=A0A889IW35_9GAMA|nr:hypothetical protein [Otarine gammaherpesvirus 4]